MIIAAPLRIEDRADWEILSRGYKAFYETSLPDECYETAWQRLLARRGVEALGAHLEGRLIGIAHFLFHASVWVRRVCYLQDLYVAEEHRGFGAARTLIETVANVAARRGAERLYWQTREDNVRARRLYDQVGQFHGFVRYDHPLGPSDLASRRRCDQMPAAAEEPR